MERLTKFDYENYRALKPKQDVVDKLGELEDVLEKYNIEDVEDLKNHLEFRINYINSKKFADLVSENIELRQKMNEPKEDKFVIVSNAWKHNKKYGIAKVQQIMTNYYILQTNDYLGSYVPCIQYGEFATKEEAEKKLAEIGRKDE